MRWPWSRRREKTQLETLVDELVSGTDDGSVVWDYDGRANVNGEIVEARLDDDVTQGLYLGGGWFDGGTLVARPVPESLTSAIKRQRIEAQMGRIADALSRFMGGDDR